ncbi:flagellar biosynthetic protein FliO [Rheinheimera pacifica]|uniref:flagellar biosynthetic protein FliO n=1 Tax=Rheinheimera pacifica TaxID=173990 RepID=UPI00285ECC00|nr:flagellar biosynthetic protein FliO [Rheinheimera pacifica]MDR6983952.1 flagellar biosynthetic protein FliO [Rheinheimera pacifica]
MPLKTEAPAERPSAGLGLGKMALSLAIVVAIVLTLGWAFKKLTLRLPGSRHIKIISTMPLGPKERLLVVEMQGKQRVLGVTAHSINLLFELENPLPEEKLASDFHTQLQSFLKK